jgi:uncharacterized membrane protein YedE/YeeE
MAIHEKDTVTGSVGVMRGLNEIRLAVLGIVVTIGLTVGFGVQCSWWVRTLAGLGSFVLACAFLKVPHLRKLAMRFAHWLAES